LFTTLTNFETLTPVFIGVTEGATLVNCQTRDIGHINSNGCHRCHDNNHKSESGKVISRDCNLCHMILAQGNPEQMKEVGVRDSLEFIHPVDIGEAWKEFHCSECHQSLY
jgi:hypothetical protein